VECEVLAIEDSQANREEQYAHCPVSFAQQMLVSESWAFPVRQRVSLQRTHQSVFRLLQSDDRLMAVWCVSVVPWKRATRRPSTATCRAKASGKGS